MKFKEDYFNSAVRRALLFSKIGVGISSVYVSNICFHYIVSAEKLTGPCRVLGYALDGKWHSAILREIETTKAVA